MAVWRVALLGARGSRACGIGAALRRGGALGALVLAAAAFGEPLRAPNVVPIRPTLVTSGQPGREALMRLGAEGIQAVIYLAPSNVPDAVRDEAALLRAQGIEFVHIPIPFDAPDEQHLARLSEQLKRLAERKVLVHCQVNLRASTMVFLHRVTAERAEAAAAYEAVARVWSPDPVWKRFVVGMLARHGVAFEPY